MKFFKLRQIATAVATMAISLAASATTTITFDPTGTTGTPGDITGAATFDWLPGSTLAKGVITTVNGVTGVFNGTNFTTYYQANLGNVLDSLGTTNPTLFANGTGGNYFTAVAGFGETVSCALVGPCSSASFNLNTAAPSFFNIYRNSLQGDNLNGTNFANNAAGNPILSAHLILTGFGSNFAVTNPNGGLLDQSAIPGAFWSGTNTVQGVGGFNIEVMIDSVNDAYFPNLLAGSVITLSDFTGNSNLPFRQVNPSKCMSNATTSCAINSNVGSLNGSTGPDVLFQADASSSFTRFPIPEPASLALVGIALLGLGVTSRRRSV